MSDHAQALFDAHKHGWREKRASGSRVMLEHPQAPGRVVVTSVGRVGLKSSTRNFNADLKRALSEAVPERRLDLELQRETEAREKAERKIQEMKREATHSWGENQTLAEANTKLKAELADKQAEIDRLTAAAAVAVPPPPLPSKRRGRPPNSAKVPAPRPERTRAPQPVKWWLPKHKR